MTPVKSDEKEFEVHGVVLSSFPFREYDRRVSILSAERGKITVWASGARKPSSPLLAATRSFVFGTFSLRAGKSGYNLRSAEIGSYFSEIALDLERACYGSYFMELADYVSQEGLDAGELITLLYLSMKAILNERLPNPLVRRIFELRLLRLNGEYTEKPLTPSSPAVEYAWSFVLETPLSKLFTFLLTEDALLEFSKRVDEAMRDFMPPNIRSLQVLKAIG